MIGIQACSKGSSDQPGPTVTTKTSAQLLVGKKWVAVKAKLVLANGGTDTITRTDGLTSYPLSTVTFTGIGDDTQGTLTTLTQSGGYQIIGSIITITLGTNTYLAPGIASISATELQLGVNNFAYPNANGIGTTTYYRVVFVLQ